MHRLAVRGLGVLGRDEVIGVRRKLLEHVDAAHEASVPRYVVAAEQAQRKPGFKLKALSCPLSNQSNFDENGVGCFQARVGCFQARVSLRPLTERMSNFFMPALARPSSM